MHKIVAATKNKGKLEEFRRLLDGLPVELISWAEACPELEVEETGTTFEENALLKAAAICEKTGLTAFADDSGLCIDALNGDPGVYTARYGADILGEQADDDSRMDLVLKRLSGVPNEKRTARFVSAICCVFPDGRKLQCKGTCEGYIGFEKAGSEGFGYDPIFYVGEKSFAQMSGGEKDALSHRGKAMRRFRIELSELLDADWSLAQSRR